MKNQVFMLVLGVIIILFSGCATNYLIVYETSLKEVKGLTKMDSTFTFTFIPLYNGLLFKIKNNSDQTARIIWDKSYFIMPDGNSFKALNTDILKEDYEIVAKAKYISTIPSNSTFKRFTTSALNSDKIIYVDISEFNYRWKDFNTSYTDIIKEEFIKFNTYWPISITVEDSLADTTPQLMFSPISEFISNNNNLGLGLVLEHNGIETEYRFDIIITKAHFILRKEDESKSSNEKRVYNYFLEYTLDVDDRNWKKVQKVIE